MKKTQLYIKNNKGRYEPYKESEIDVSDTMYRKINGKYEPVGKFIHRDYLTEGVWVVYRNGYCNGKYLKDKFVLDKVSDLKYPTIAEIGGLQAAINQAMHERPAFEDNMLKSQWGLSIADSCEFVARRTVEILKEKENGKKNIT